jgi:hypothetical protein
MPQKLSEDEIQEILDRFGLPKLPDEADEDEETAELCISQFNGPKIYLERLVTVEDAKAYCDREDNHGNGWFVMFYRR